MYFTYVLKNLQGILYKGSTDNLTKRIIQHNSNGSFPSFTKKKGPWKLVYYEEYATRKEAEKREKFFKTGKGREFLKGRLSGLDSDNNLAE